VRTWSQAEHVDEGDPLESSTPWLGFHLQGGGDLVWNVGTGYFGCGSGKGANRVFEPALMKETIDAGEGRIKMNEIKLSQGAKPRHGGI
jgi:glutamate synthase domain-containing protein 2